MAAKKVDKEDKKGYHLFNIQVLLKSVSIDHNTLFSDMFPQSTFVQFGFYIFPNEEALKFRKFARYIGAKYNEQFNAGKSVTFPINHEEVKDCTVDMKLDFEVNKLDNNNQPVIVATGSLNLSREFYAIRGYMLEWKKGYRELNTVVPLTCRPMHPETTAEGNLYVHVRMEEYGDIQITEFRYVPSIREISPFHLVGVGEMTMHYDLRELNPDLATHSGNPHKLFHNRMLESNLCAPCRKQQKVASEKDESGMWSKGDDKMLPDVNSNDMMSRSSHSSRSPFCKPVVLKVSGLFDNGDNGGKKPTVTVAAAEPDTVKPDAMSSQHDIFVLRIGKKGLVGVNEKSDIQLEMKTPKGSERRPAIRHETRDIQTDLEEAEQPPQPRLPRNHRPEKKKRKKK